MLYRLYIMICFMLVGSFCASLDAEIHESAKQKIRTELKAERFHELGVFLKEGISHSESDLTALEEIALEEKSQYLQRAVKAAKQFKKIEKNLGVSIGTFLETAFFIETSLKKYIDHKHNFLPKSKTALPHSLEYDPKSKRVFIILDGMDSAYLGRGGKKIAYKSIQYKNGKSIVVARAEQGRTMNLELKITKHLQGAPGILEIRGFGHHKANGKEYNTTYSKLYTSGNLKDVFKKNIKLSLYEKVKIAFNILQGLESMHKRKIVHRDLCSQNIFVSIHKEKGGKRDVEAVIADFGWAKYTKNLIHQRPQGNIRNTAPEGLFVNKMKGSTYFATDVYAAGRALYRLFYEENVEWQDGIRPGSAKFRYDQLVRKINHVTKARREHLANKYARHELSHAEHFEYIILHMVHPDPKMRGTATELRKKLQILLIK